MIHLSISREALLKGERDETIIVEETQSDNDVTVKEFAKLVVDTLKRKGQLDDVLNGTNPEVTEPLVNDEKEGGVNVLRSV